MQKKLPTILFIYLIKYISYIIAYSSNLRNIINSYKLKVVRKSRIDFLERI